jgi:membrane fusion protein (multidrug efflux system)
MRLFLWAAVILAGLVLLALQMAKRAEESSARVLLMEREIQAAKVVEAERIRPSVWERWKVCYGQARAAKAMNVTSLARETVESVRVNVGDRVQAGQVLLTLRQEDRAAGERAGAAAYADAKRTYERLSTLHKEGGVSGADADRAYAAMKSEEAKLQHYRSELKQTQIRSKIPGIVTARNVEPGEIAEAGQTLLSVESAGDVEIQFMVSARDIGGIDEKTPFEIIVDGTPFKGKVKRVNPKAQEGSGLCQVITAIDRGAGVLPGTYLEGAFLVHSEPDAVVVPSSALIDRDGERFVYVVSGDIEKTACLTRIETGDGKSGRVLVKSGLTPGDLLITSGSSGLSDGIPVSYDLPGGGID